MSETELEKYIKETFGASFIIQEMPDGTKQAHLADDKKGLLDPDELAKKAADYFKAIQNNTADLDNPQDLRHLTQIDTLYEKQETDPDSPNFEHDRNLIIGLHDIIGKAAMKALDLTEQDKPEEQRKYCRDENGLTYDGNGGSGELLKFFDNNLTKNMDEYAEKVASCLNNDPEFQNYCKQWENAKLDKSEIEKLKAGTLTITEGSDLESKINTRKEIFENITNLTNQMFANPAEYELDDTKVMGDYEESDGKIHYSSAVLYGDLPSGKLKDIAIKFMPHEQMHRQQDLIGKGEIKDEKNQTLFAGAVRNKQSGFGYIGNPRELCAWHFQTKANALYMENLEKRQEDAKKIAQLRGLAPKDDIKPTAKTNNQPLNPTIASVVTSAKGGRT